MAQFGRYIQKSHLNKDWNKNELIIGEKIKIRSATILCKEKVFERLTNSNLMKEMMGHPFYVVAIA